MALFVQAHFCPECMCALNGEHYSEEWNRTRTEIIFRRYCEFCHRGWETICDVVDGAVVRDINFDYSARTEPIEFGKFLQRLADQRTVNA